MSEKNFRSNAQPIYRDHELMDDIDLVKRKMRETRDALSKTAHDMGGRAEELFMQSLRDAKNKTHDIQENVVSYVKEHPVKSVGFAVLAGIVLSILLKK